MANLQTFERSEYQQVKSDLHRKILDRLDLEKLGRSTGNPPAKKFSFSFAIPLTAKSFPSALPNASASREKFWTRSSALVRSNLC